MISLIDFKKLVADDIQNLSEKEVELAYRIATVFGDVGIKKWIKKKLIEQAEK